MARKKLVSILIPNYNYGHYLRNCLDSILAQTYQDIEVIFRDNYSTDDSFDIAIEYYYKFKEKGIYFSIHKNGSNYGSEVNTNLCITDCHGDYLYILASDDSIEPTFIETCVGVLENNKDVAMVMTHRNEVDENGNVTKTKPFYNQDCIVDGESQAAVFMMAGIAIPGQRMTKREYANQMKNYLRIWNVAGDWYNNFLYAMCGDVAYITEPLCNYRVHSGNETNESEKKLLGIFEHYQLINAFCDVAESFGMTKPQKRYGDAVRKLGDMCLRYALKMYKCKEIETAKRYLSLAPAFKTDIVEDDRYIELLKMSNLQDDEMQEAVCLYEEKHTLTRTVSYDPPEGFTKLRYR